MEIEIEMFFYFYEIIFFYFMAISIQSICHIINFLKSSTNKQEVEERESRGFGPSNSPLASSFISAFQLCRPCWILARGSHHKK